MKNFFKHIVMAIITWEAKAALKRHVPKIIAVTGSVGKTGTKDAIYALVSQSFSARKSEKSMNSEIGLPLTILGLDTAWTSLSGWISNIVKGFVTAFFSKDFPQWLVLEVGADHPGDIESLTHWLSPDIVVLTRMSETPVHVEYFKDAGEVLKEKMYLAQALKPGGTLIVNADDPHFMKAVRNSPVHKMFYGKSPDARVQILESKVIYSDGVLPLPLNQGVIIRFDDVQKHIVIPHVLGSHLMYSVAASCAVGLVLGIESKISDAFVNFKNPKGRMNILQGVSGCALLDDTYNSSPIACIEALKALGGLSIRGRKIAVLADMKELGTETENAHRGVGKHAFEQLHTLITVGDAARFIAAGAHDAGMAVDRIMSFDTAEEAGQALLSFIRAGDVVLIKGSQSMRMETVSKMLLEDKEKAGELLVRQEKEWTVR